ncbi:MAG: FtsH protease activity modulator HflK [Alphaproteobacteria bacterium]
MPWQQQGGSGGGGGPWDSGSRGKQPPDLEEMIRKGQEKFRGMVPGGMGSGKVIGLAVLGIILLWMFSGIYRVQPGERGVELMFGKFVKETNAGLHIWAPAPFGQVLKPNVERTNEITVGYRGGGGGGHSATTRDVPQESLMLTGDQNIIDIDYVVQWRIKNARDYLFNIRDVATTIKLASESAIREVVGQTPLEDALALKRTDVEIGTKVLLQKILDDYGAGVFIADVKMQKVDPPQPVIDAFNDVQRAKQDQERERNEAEAYANDIIPRAKGEAQRQIQQATAYREQQIKQAEGEASRFLSVYNAYKGGKEVTIKRLYLERMQEVLKNSTKVIIDSGKGGPGVVPYLPLPEIEKRRTGASTAGGGN